MQRTEELLEQLHQQSNLGVEGYGFIAGLIAALIVAVTWRP